MMSFNKALKFTAAAGLPVVFLLTGCDDEKKEDNNTPSSDDISSDEITDVQAKVVTAKQVNEVDQRTVSKKSNTEVRGDQHVEVEVIPKAVYYKTAFESALKDQKFYYNNALYTCKLGNHYRKFLGQTKEEKLETCNRRVKTAVKDEKYMADAKTIAFWGKLHLKHQKHNGTFVNKVRKDLHLFWDALHHTGGKDEPSFGEFVIKCHHDFENSKPTLGVDSFKSLEMKLQKYDKEMTDEKWIEFKSKIATLWSAWNGDEPVAVHYEARNGEMIKMAPRKDAAYEAKMEKQAAMKKMARKQDTLSAK